MLLKLILFLPAFGFFALPISGQDSQPSTLETTAIEKERTPRIEKFYALVRSADRIEVVWESEGKKKVLYRSSNRSDLEEFRKAVVLKTPNSWTMSICPEPRVVLYKGRKELGWVANVLGRDVLTSVWGGNAPLADGEKWLKWFDDRGMPLVRQQKNESEAAGRKYAEDENRWVAAMPRGIGEQYEKQLGFFGLPSMNYMKPFLPILEREYPNQAERILALLHWLGSGSGPWNGSPAYESIAERLLLEFATVEILNAVSSMDLKPTQVEGTARLFAGWDFSRTRPDDLKLLSPELKKTLYDHVIKSNDMDKRERAIGAFKKQ